jgi:DNA-binding NarL/FixJ family response regulator
MRCCVLGAVPERREGLKALLRQINRRASFSESQDWRQTASMLQRAPTDLLVIDWQNSLDPEDVRRLLANFPGLRVAVLADECAASAVPLLKAGVLGVVPRQLEPRLIVRLFELIMLGGQYVPPSAVDVPLVGLAPERSRAHHADGDRAARGDAATLSPRQRQIIEFVHLGATNKMIARTLSISEGTVKIHLASVFQQLGATNRAAAVALYNGWQFDALSVLHDGDPAPAQRPRLGQLCLVPLRPLRAARPRKAATRDAPSPARVAAQNSGPRRTAAEPCDKGKSAFGPPAAAKRQRSRPTAGTAEPARDAAADVPPWPVQKVAEPARAYPDAADLADSADPCSSETE